MERLKKMSFRCPHCATEYDVTYTHSTTKDSGSAYCKNCRKKMSEWNDYPQPSFTAVSESLRDTWPTNATKAR
jgi:hypothetical protein